MKKLMIAAAAVAMIGSAFADAQVYDVKLSVKTTGCKDGKVSKAMADYTALAKGSNVQYRKQATRTIQGVIWGCDCETIATPMWRVYNASKAINKQTVGGYQFWDATDKVARPFCVPYTTFDWVVLNRIDQFNKVEGTWQLKDNAASEAFYFLGAGFGSCKNNNNECLSYISSMSGNFAGWMQIIGGNGESDGCVFCGDIVTTWSCLCAPFCFCQNLNGFNPMLTAAYGTWSIKYNSSASKKLVKKYSILDVVNFNTKKLVEVGISIDAAEAAAKGVTFVAAGEKKEEGIYSDPTTTDVKDIADPMDLLKIYFKNLSVLFKEKVEDPGKATDQKIDDEWYGTLKIDGLAAKLADLS